MFVCLSVRLVFNVYAAYFLFVYVSNVSCLEPLKPSGRGHVYVGEIFSQNVRPET